VNALEQFAERLGALHHGGRETAAVTPGIRTLGHQAVHRGRDGNRGLLGRCDRDEQQHP